MGALPTERVGYGHTTTVSIPPGAGPLTWGCLRRRYSDVATGQSRAGIPEFQRTGRRSRLVLTIRFARNTTSLCGYDSIAITIRATQAAGILLCARARSSEW